MNKRGVLFTMATIFLLLSSFILAKAWSQRASDADAILLMENAASKIRYLEDDVISMTYKRLLPIHVGSITRSPLTVSVLFNDIIRLKDNRDFDGRLDNYESFIEGTYASLHNANITLENVSANLSIDPYGSVLDLNKDNLYIYNQNSLTDLAIRLKVNKQNPGLDTSSTTAGATDVRIIVLNEDDDVKYDATAAVSPAASNSWTFKAGVDSLFTIQFGNFSALPNATLYVNPSIYTEIHQIQLDFAQNAVGTVVRGGRIAVTVPGSNMTLTHDIILLEE